VGRRTAPQFFGRQATGSEIAYAALFVMSDEAVYVTGQTLAVDSGLTGVS
jgi:NAD(P)-dependent dehydrogenase (short-subunit alcohol dehydrogenase family)